MPDLNNWFCLLVVSVTFGSCNSQNVYCSDDNSCQNSVINSVNEVTCSGAYSCIGITLFNVTSIICSGGYSCMNTTLTNLRYVSCLEYYACENTVFRNVDEILCYDYDSCSNARFENNINQITCYAPDACQYNYFGHNIDNVYCRFSKEYYAGSCNNVDSNSVGLKECVRDDSSSSSAGDDESSQEFVCEHGENCGIICDHAGFADCSSCYAFCYGDCYCATEDACGIEGIAKVEWSGFYPCTNIHNNKKRNKTLKN